MDAPVFEPECVIVVGSTGSGKSTWLADFVKQYRRNAIVYKHAINIDDKAFHFLTEKTTSNYRQGVKPGEMVKCKMSGEDEKDWNDFLKWSRMGFRHGIVILDDSQMFEVDRPSPLFRKTLIMKRHMVAHIFVVYHGLEFIPVEIFGLANKIVLFNTTGNPRYRKSKIPNYDALMKGVAMARANYLSADKKYTPVIVRLQ